MDDDQHVTSVTKDIKNSRRRQLNIDRGYAWLVLLVSVLLSILNGGVYYTVGILVPEFIEQFSVNEVFAVTLGSIQNGLYGFSGYVAGSLIDRFGCRSMSIIGTFLVSFGFALSAFVESFEFMIITFSVLPGIGLGIQSMGATVIVQHYFDVKRPFATGLVMSGCPLGAILVPPLLRFLLNLYGWRGCLLVMSAVVLHGCAFAIFYTPPTTLRKMPTDSNRHASSRISDKLKRVGSCLCKVYLFRHVFFDALLFIVILFNLGINAPYIFMPLRMHNLGYSGWQAASAVSLIGAGDCFGRAFSGWFAYATSINRLLLMAVSIAASCVLSIAAGLFDDITVLYIYGFGIGFNIGCFVTLNSIVVVDILGVAFYSQAYGLQRVFVGLALLIGPVFLAHIHQMCSSMGVIFGVVAVMQFCATGITLALYCQQRSKNTGDSQELNEISRRP